MKVVPYKIVKGKPLPNHIKSIGSRYHFLDMAPGDAFWAPVTKKTLQSNANHFKRGDPDRKHMRFAYEEEEVNGVQGCWVWRVDGVKEVEI